MSGGLKFDWDTLFDDLETLKDGYDWVTESWDVWTEIDEVYQWTGENLDGIRHGDRPGEVTQDDLEFFIQLVRVLKMVNKFNVPVVGDFVDAYLTALTDTLKALQDLYPSLNFTERMYQQWKPLIEAGQVDEGTMGIPLEVYDQMRLRFLREEYEAIRQERLAERRRSEREKHREQYEKRSRINPRWYWHWWWSKISYLGPNLDPTMGMAAMAGILVLIVVLAGGAFFLFGGDDPAAMSAGPAVPTAVAGVAATPTATATPTVVAARVDPLAGLTTEQRPFGELVTLLICGPMPPDDVCNEAADILALPLLNEVTPSPTVHSSNDIQPKEPDVPETRVRFTSHQRRMMAGELLDRLFTNTVFPCGEGELALTLCPNPSRTVSAGEHLAIAVILDAELDYDATEDDVYVYAFVFDGDGIEENNYRAGPAFPNDFYDNTDTWYEVIRDTTGWRLAISRVRGGGWMPVESAARVIVYRNTLLLLVPIDEFDVTAPPYRTTSFWHRGDFGMNPPHDWSGTVLPPVGQPLIVP